MRTRGRAVHRRTPARVPRTCRLRGETRGRHGDRTRGISPGAQQPRLEPPTVTCAGGLEPSSPTSTESTIRRDSADRMVLGVRGQVSKLERDNSVHRMVEARWSKARRGELHYSPPAGYDIDDQGQVVMSCDEAVIEAIQTQTVFSKFGELGSARQVLVWWRDQGRKFPVRTVNGRAHLVEWRKPNYGMSCGLACPKPAQHSWARSSSPSTDRSRALVSTRPVLSRCTCIDSAASRQFTGMRIESSEGRCPVAAARNMTRYCKKGCPSTMSTLLDHAVARAPRSGSTPENWGSSRLPSREFVRPSTDPDPPHPAPAQEIIRPQTSSHPAPCAAVRARADRPAAPCARAPGGSGLGRTRGSNTRRRAPQGQRSTSISKVRFITAAREYRSGRRRARRDGVRSSGGVVLRRIRCADSPYFTPNPLGGLDRQSSSSDPPAAS